MRQIWTREIWVAISTSPRSVQASLASVDPGSAPNYTLNRYVVSHPPTWQVIGTAEYAPNPWLNLQLGYRNLNFNYQASGRDLGFNLHMKGAR